MRRLARACPLRYTRDYTENRTNQNAIVAAIRFRTTAQWTCFYTGAQLENWRQVASVERGSRTSLWWFLARVFLGFMLQTTIESGIRM